MNKPHSRTTINERIKLVMNAFNYKSKRSFAEKIGIAQTSFNDIIKGAEPKFSTLEKILMAEPSISAEWLIRGEGEMLEPLEKTGTDVPKTESFSDSKNIETLIETIAILQEVIRDKNERIKTLECNMAKLTNKDL